MFSLALFRRSCTFGPEHVTSLVLHCDLVCLQRGRGLENANKRPGNGDLVGTRFAVTALSVKYEYSSLGALNRWEISVFDSLARNCGILLNWEIAKRVSTWFHQCRTSDLADLLARKTPQRTMHYHASTVMTSNDCSTTTHTSISLFTGAGQRQQRDCDEETVEVEALNIQQFNDHWVSLLL